jgi:hypothetical protein
MGEFIAAIGRDPSAIHNQIAEFYVPTTIAVLPGRVERGELVEEHAAFVRGQAERDLSVSRAWVAFYGDVRERVVAKKVPEAIAAKAGELRAELAAGEAEIRQLEDAAALRKSNSFPSLQYTIDGPRATLPPEVPWIMNRLLDRLSKETLTRWRSILVESARRGDDQPFLATEHFTARLIRDEILDDERTMNALTDVFTTRAGTKQWIASAEMAAQLARTLLEHTRAFIDGSAGVDPNREAPLQTPDGREIRRRG